MKKKAIVISESSLRKMLVFAGQRGHRNFDEVAQDLLLIAGANSSDRSRECLLAAPIEGFGHYNIKAEFEFVIQFPANTRPEWISPLKDAYKRQLDEGLGVWVGRSCNDALKACVNYLKGCGFREFGIYERSSRIPLCVTPRFRWERETEASLGKDGGYEQIEYVPEEDIHVKGKAPSERHGSTDPVPVEAVLGFRW